MPTKYKAKVISVQPTPTDVGGGQTTKSWQERDIEFRIRRAARQDAEKIQEENEATAKREAVVRKQDCIAAQQNLRTLLGRGAVYSLNEKGEPEYFDDAKRTAEIERAKKEIQTFCVLR